jgi:two-component system, OmpR family, osmolarity sensor histidine kinase EnvZ
MAWLRFQPFKWMKPYMPKSLYGRALAILVVPLIVVMAATIYIFVDHHLDTITHRLADDIAGEISSVTEVYRSKTMDRKQAIAFASDHYQMNLAFEDVYAAKKGEKTTMRAIGEWFLEESLSDYLKVPFYVKLNKSTIYVDVILSDEVMHFETPRKRLLSKTTPVYLLWVVFLPILMFVIAALFMKNQVRSLRRLVQSADKFGKGLSVPPIKPEGATEIRQAAVAFNRMQERIHRQISQRTEMLAGVSHDLRTPLTRMELQLAMLESSAEVEGLKADVTEMRKMVDSYLAFARGEEPEKAVMTNIYDLLEAVAEPYGAKIALPKRLSCRRPVKVQCMKRCFQNLLDNADKFAKHIQVSMEAANDSFEIVIEDDGPGIPENKRQEVFRPFYRLDTSRNLDQGGVGLGLSIAQDAVHQHGGTIELGDSALGGVKVCMKLPV